MKFLYLIALTLLLTEGVHMQFMLRTPMVHLQAQATCSQEIQTFMGKLQAFATKISSGDMSTLVAD